MEGKTHHTVEDRKQRHEMYGDDVLNALLCGSKIHHVLKKKIKTCSSLMSFYTLF